MISIGHKLGQLVIIDLLRAWCCFLRFDLASLLYIWSLFRSVSEQAVSRVWIVSLEGRDHIVILCLEKGIGERCPDNKRWWWAQVGDLAHWSGQHGQRAQAFFLRDFSLTTSLKLLFTLIWSLILFYFKKKVRNITCLLLFCKHSVLKVDSQWLFDAHSESSLG